MKELFAKRLKNARIMAGLSMDALALLIDLSKEAIRKYEHAETQPNSGNLIKLSKALNVNIDYFFRAFNVELGQVEFRKKSKLGVSKTNQIKERVKDNLERYLELESILAIQSDLKNPIAHIHIQCNNDVEIAAQEVRKAWHLGLNPIASIIETMEDNYIKVVEVAEPMEFDGLSTLIDGKIPVIVINKNFPIERKRFTLLHELGHLLLDIPDDVPQKEKERYCNRFAGAFLIPKTSFIFEMGIQRKSVTLNEIFQIQKEWGLSVAAIVYRAKDLNVITERKCTGFFIRCRQDKAFKDLIDEERYPQTESSNRFNQLIARGVSMELISLSKASVLSNIPANKIKSEIAFI